MTTTPAPQAKYLRVREELAERLAHLPYGSALPTERDLAAELGVARMTLRKAVDHLVTEGRLVRRQGAGTFVAPPRVHQRLHASSFSEDMRARGLRPGARTLAASTGSAAADVAAALDVPVGAPVLHVVRLRLADDVPMAVEDLHVPADLVPGLTGEELAGRSFYELLATRYGLEVSRGVQTIEPVVVDAARARDLDVAPGVPAFLFERTTRVSTGRVVELVRSVYRGDRYRILVDITRPSAPEHGATPEP
ncbi:GntR family transcriptional regulator [Pseudokineococcus basanitobsidens]|uniref:GntR family transcriptional regulator n=1 Tax=Pseudokineococcus basanitobsidens TaxID=1926649 RepID=A0ABU8RF87_9ACTN